MHFDLDYKDSGNIYLHFTQSRLLSTMLRKNDRCCALPSSSFSGSLPRPPRLGHANHGPQKIWVCGPWLAGFQIHNTRRVYHRPKTTGFLTPLAPFRPTRVLILFHIGNVRGITLSVSKRPVPGFSTWFNPSVTGNTTTIGSS